LVFFFPVLRLTVGLTRSRRDTASLESNGIGGAEAFFRGIA